jgi:hypothetical protein
MVRREMQVKTAHGVAVEKAREAGKMRCKVARLAGSL